MLLSPDANPTGSELSAVWESMLAMLCYPTAIVADRERVVACNGHWRALTGFRSRRIGCDR